MRTFLYLIGVPGVGKSTVMKELVHGQPAYQMRSPVPHIVYGDGRVAQIGVDREAFSGTDALSMSIQPTVEEWLQQRPYPTLLAEGDRLANDKFFHAVEKAGYTLRLALLFATPGKLTLRRANRQIALSSKPQDSRWLAGRSTKVENLAFKWQPLLVDNTTIPKALQAISDMGWHPFLREGEEMAGYLEATP